MEVVFDRRMSALREHPIDFVLRKFCIQSLCRCWGEHLVVIIGSIMEKYIVWLEFVI